MPFNSLKYFYFLPVVYLVFYLAANERAGVCCWRQPVILCALKCRTCSWF